MINTVSSLTYKL